MALYKAGLRLRYVRAGKYRYCYGERGRPSHNKTSLVLVHGFSASKDMWVPIVQVGNHGNQHFTGSNYGTINPLFEEAIKLLLKMA